jgi:hypothetical protein
MEAVFDARARTVLDPARPREDAPPAPNRTLWLRLHLLTLAVAGMMLGYVGRRHWFWADEWNFILDRVETPTLGLFTPSNEHWSTIPILIYRALYATVGLDSYLPYLAVVLTFHLVLTHILWRVSIRVGARPAIATAVAGVFAVLGAGAENLLWAFQIGFVGALSCGWLAVLLHDHDGPFDRRDLLGWAATTTALMLAGIGVTVVGITALSVALRRRRLRDVGMVAAVPAAVFAGWWAIVGRRYVTLGTTDKVDVVRFAWHGVVNVADQVVGIAGIGWLLVLALALWWVRHMDDATGRAAPAAAAFVGTFAFFVLAGNGRAFYGVLAADASRYVYVGSALLAPSVALALSRVVPTATASRHVVTGVVVVACALVALHNVQLLRERSATEVGREQGQMRQVAALAELLEDDDPVVQEPAGFPVGMYDSVALYPDNLGRLLDDGWNLSATPRTPERLQAELLWQTGLEEPSDDLDRVAITGQGVTATPTDGCLNVRGIEDDARLSYRTGADGSRVRMTAAEGVDLTVQLVDGQDTSGSLELQLPGATPRDLVSYAEARTVVVTLPTGENITVCGVVADPDEATRPGSIGSTPNATGGQ